MENFLPDDEACKQPEEDTCRPEDHEQTQGEQWLKENLHAIEAYNVRVVANGLFGDGLKTF
ncbi:TPA: type II toxin-antitoxin system CcdA family antitoxin [Pseudomonas aeruginosa]|uniref:type II toxin-antitoxin system CcdA family antitoxin n=1 Tax=Pseudomonas aeruginosa TaxID=287 RepID=UPI000940F4EB|nr:type II toxin-antitoxin system CcdA family antitoxin [Pseudomonas aeruginosa]ELD5770464.1 type II toxin-antitoxin system CcdA family antitoxin [Pseudomonas aeruginosa]MBG4035090.1 type II toxin-antitoxin system CcdA family antitoxin [Pseudomonas aeruginosa]MBG7063746.1 type II toxin-antitoxin system CcdA family antitoxin [Pseudomonas aeruginosa]MBH3964829.1 type II toxin-antitoxin system CcdA family antitoxin [Pseudomonas aeruginosa]MBH4157654.1 type II toxin-antitoxin system CcdA family an